MARLRDALARSTRPLWCLILGALLLVPFLAAPRAAGAAGMAQVRLVHASPDAPALDVYIDGQRVTTAMKFAETTAYVALPAGNRAVQVLAAGAGQGGQAIIATSVDFEEGRAYTIVAADLLARIGAVVLTDDLAARADGQAYLRVVHASPDAPSVADVAVVGGPVALRNLPFKGAGPYLPLAPGSYAFEVRPAGTTQAIATTGPLTLEGGRLYSVFVVGQLGDKTFRALLVADNAGNGGVAAAPSTGGGGLARVGDATAPALALALLAACLAPRAIRRAARRVGAGA